MNRIPCSEFKKISCKLYYKIINDLEKNQLIRRNNHYCHSGPEEKHFSKSYLFSHRFQTSLRKLKHKLKAETIDVELPRKLEEIIQNKMKTVKDAEENRKLNTYLVEESRTDEIDSQSFLENYYSELKFSERSLEDLCNGDEWREIHLRRELNKLKKDAIWKSGRWYHEFHRLSKECREKVLRFEGEHIKEIFDVSGSDLHMLAKHLENIKDIPIKELMKFQRDVMRDFRKDFGARMTDGKCKASVKTAFKVYLNSKKSFYHLIRSGSICSRIDEYFKQNYPHIRSFIIEKDDIWKDVMLSEFDIISVKMFKDLQQRGVKALTCHDAVYVKESVDVPDIKDLFYECLGLSAYWQDRLDEL